MWILTFKSTSLQIRFEDLRARFDVSEAPNPPETSGVSPRSPPLLSLLRPPAHHAIHFSFSCSLCLPVSLHLPPSFPQLPRCRSRRPSPWMWMSITAVTGRNGAAVTTTETSPLTPPLRSSCTGWPSLPRCSLRWWLDSLFFELSHLVLHMSRDTKSECTAALLLKLKVPFQQTFRKVPAKCSSTKNHWQSTHKRWSTVLKLWCVSL